MDPIHYLLHLLEQGVAPQSALAHVRHRHGLSEDALIARVTEARNAAHDLLKLTEGLAFDA